MRTLTSKQCLTSILLAGIFFAALAWQRSVYAGGPLAVGGPLVPNTGQPFVWPAGSIPVGYTTDNGRLGLLSELNAQNLVVSLFQLWEDVPTSAIGFNRTGFISTALVPGGDVSDISEFNALGTTGNPIIYDDDGSINAALGNPPGVIGFAGPAINSSGNIVAARALLNGIHFDGISSPPSNPSDLTQTEFEAVFAHEFGHFFGMDHSQVNINCLVGGCASGSDDAFGLPTMFPFLISGLTETPGVHPARTLSQDDIAWVSRLYPETLNMPPDRVPFNTGFGTISGTILFSDGITHVQGVNVIARQVGDARRTAVSVVSGYLFTGNPGQNLTGTNPGASLFFGGSREPTLIGTYDIPVPPGDYTVEVESIFAGFTGGSSVGPLGNDFPDGVGEQLPLPGPVEFWDMFESATDDPMVFDVMTVSMGGDTIAGIDIILNGTPPRFDSFETSRLWLLEPLPLWVREEIPAAYLVAG